MNNLKLQDENIFRSLLIREFEERTLHNKKSAREDIYFYYVVANEPFAFFSVFVIVCIHLMILEK